MQTALFHIHRVIPEPFGWMVLAVAAAAVIGAFYACVSLCLDYIFGVPTDLKDPDAYGPPPVGPFEYVVWPDESEMQQTRRLKPLVGYEPEPRKDPPILTASIVAFPGKGPIR